MSRAINIVSSAEIAMSGISIANSTADYNNLLYLSETMDLSIAKFNVYNISKSQPSKLNFLKLNFLFMKFEDKPSNNDTN